MVQRPSTPHLGAAGEQAANQARGGQHGEEGGGGLAALISRLLLLGGGLLCRGGTSGQRPAAGAARLGSGRRRPAGQEGTARAGADPGTGQACSLRGCGLTVHTVCVVLGWPLDGCHWWAICSRAGRDTQEAD